MNKENLPILGKILTDVSVVVSHGMSLYSGREDKICFTCADGTKYVMYHDQECGESVVIDDISGDWDDLIGNPLLIAEAASKSSTDDEKECGDSQTWTFYRLATIGGYVDIRWLGESNGYYSESVTFIECKDELIN
jgi:hypothetical protein